MFKLEIELIQKIFTDYFAGVKSSYFMLLLIAIVGLFVLEKKRENRNLLVYYPAILLILACSPVFCHGMLKFIEKSVYYRVLWLLPIGILLAYSGTILITKAGHTAKKVIASLLFIGLIAFSGKFVYTAETFEKVNNWYKLPDEYVEVAEILHEMPLAEKKAMLSTELVEYIRQLDASIQLTYSRRPYQDYERFPMVNAYNAGDTEKLVSLCAGENVNVIIYDKSIPLSTPLENYGFELYEETAHYDIYIIKE